MSVTDTCACGTPVWIVKTGECKRCYHRRYHRENRRPAPRSRTGETPETATQCTYLAAHLRVHHIRGKASAHACTECGQPADEWSYRGGSEHELTGSREVWRQGVLYTKQSTWSPYIWDYDPMCTDCHRERDIKTKEQAA